MAYDPFLRNETGAAITAEQDDADKTALATYVNTGLFAEPFLARDGTQSEVARSLKARASERMYSILDYIAGGETTINNALSRILTKIGSGKAVIYFPRAGGPYPLGGGGVTISSKTGLRFLSDDGAVIQAGAVGTQSTGMTVTPFLLSSCAECVVRGLEFDGGGFANAALGHSGGSDNLYEDLIVSNCAGASPAHLQGTGGSRNRVRGVRVKGADLGTAVRGIWLGHYTTSGLLEHDATVENCKIDNCSATGLICIGHRNVLRGNDIWECAGAGIITASANGNRNQHTSILDNRCWSNTFHGIQGDANTGSTNIALGGVIKNNKCWLNGNTGILVNVMKLFLIEANECWDNASEGIQVAQSENCALIGNIIHETRSSTSRTQQWGIRINCNGLVSKDLQIKENMVTNQVQGGIFLQQVGVGTAHGIAINENHLTDNGGWNLVVQNATSANVTKGQLHNNTCLRAGYGPTGDIDTSAGGGAAVTGFDIGNNVTT